MKHVEYSNRKYWKDVQGEWVYLLRHNRYIDNKFYYFEVICFELNVNVITGSCESIFGTKVQVQVHPKKLFLLIFFNV